MLMTLFILLVLFNTQQVAVLMPEYFVVGGFGVTWFDLVTVCAFIYWITQSSFTNKPSWDLKKKINKTYFMFLLVGLIPVFIGFINGKSNLLYAYRFFFYFVWVPVLIQLLQKPRRATKVLTYLIIINSVSIVVALFTHLREVGFTIFYLTNYRELNLIVSLVLLSFLMAKDHLLGKKMDVLIFILCILALLFDQSRKIQIAFLLGSIILYFNYKKIQKRKVIINKQVLAVILLIIVGLGFMGLWSTVIERLGTVIVTPSQIQSGTIEPSAFFRLYALIGGIELVKEHPFTGMGAGDAMEIEQYMLGASGISRNLSPHNFYLSEMLYYGIPIVLLIYLIIFRFIRQSLHEIRKVPSPLVSKQKITALGITAGYIGFMVAMFFEGYAVQSIVNTWLFFGLMLGFINLCSKIMTEKKMIAIKQLNSNKNK